MAEHFVIAGAQRSATSWLAGVLDRHPDIAMARPMRPEPKYFLRAGPDDAMAYRAEFFAGADHPEARHKFRIDLDLQNDVRRDGR